MDQAKYDATVTGMVESGRHLRQQALRIAPVGVTAVSAYPCKPHDLMCPCVQMYRPNQRLVHGWHEAEHHCMRTRLGAPYMCASTHYGPDNYVLGLPIDALRGEWGVTTTAISKMLEYYSLDESCLFPVSVEHGPIVPIDVLATLCTGTQPQQTDAIIELLVYLAQRTADMEYVNRIRYAIFCKVVRDNITTVSTQLHALETMVMNMADAVNTMRAALSASQNEATHLRKQVIALQHAQNRETVRLNLLAQDMSERKRAQEQMRMANAALLYLAGFRNDALAAPPPSLHAGAAVLGDAEAGAAIGALAAGAAAGCVRAGAILASGGPIEPPARRVPPRVQMPIAALREMWDRTNGAARELIDLAAVANGGVVPTLSSTMPGPPPTTTHTSKRTGRGALQRVAGTALNVGSRQVGRPKRAASPPAGERAAKRACSSGIGGVGGGE